MPNTQSKITPTKGNAARISKLSDHARRCRLKTAKLRSASMVKNSIAFVAFMSLGMQPHLTHAETVTDRFVCTLGSNSRSIELTYLNQINEVPCEIRETREDGKISTLWRASFDVSFCHDQMKDHRSRLISYQWACNDSLVDAGLDSELSTTATSLNSVTSTGGASGLTNQNSTVDASGNFSDGRNIESTGAAGSYNSTPLIARTDSRSTISEFRQTSSSAAPSIPTEFPDTSGNTKDSSLISPAQLRALTSEVVFYEDTNDIESEQSVKQLPPPVPPGVPPEQLISDDLRQIDDWLIYLSALSMSSIGQILSDSDLIRDYQLKESLDSDNIYSRLQKRVEYLQILLEQK